MQVFAQEGHMKSLQEDFIVITENRSVLKCQAANINTQLCDLLKLNSAYDKTEATNTNRFLSPVTAISECDKRLCAVREIIQDLNETCNAISDNEEWKSSIDTIVANNCDRRKNLEDRLNWFDKFVESDIEEQSEVSKFVDELGALLKNMR
jgi:hypothetical protein